MGIRIDALASTVLPSRDHEFPAMKDGLTVRLSVGQVLDLLIGTAPGALDTLEELAAALGDDEDFAGTVMTALTARLEKADNLAALANKATARTNLGVGYADDTEQAAFRAAIGAQLEPGFLGWFAANSPPTGWLKANGAAVSRTTYAALFAAIGTTFGVGDGSTTFDLPDLRGEFLRGWDDGRGVDSSRVFGSAQSDAFQGHMHDLLSQTGGPGRYMNGSTAAASPVNFSAPSTANVSGTPGTYRLSVHNPIADGVNDTPRTAAETRPRNIAFLACIKY